MADFEDRLRTELTRRAGELAVSEDLPERIRDRVHRRRRQQRMLAGALSAVVVAAVAGLVLVRSPGDDRLETAAPGGPTTTAAQSTATTDATSTRPTGGNTEPPPEATSTTTTVAASPETPPTSTPGTSPGPTPTPTTAPLDLKPPDSQQPTAGVCAPASGPVAEITLNADVPAPRCTEVSAEQSLRVRNNTDETVSVALADYSATLPPGASRALGGAFGDYLQPGVHRITVSLYGGSGPEIDLDP